MFYSADFQWKVVVYDLANDSIIRYSYLIKKDDLFLKESKLERTLTLKTEFNVVEIFDDFVDESNVFQSLPFKSYFPHKITKQYSINQWLVQVYVPFVKRNQSVGIIGANDMLGAWQEKHILPMNYVGKGWWSVAIAACGMVEYKFVIFDKTSKNIRLWEDGNNRVTDFNETSEAMVLNTIFRHQFRWKAAGVAIPIFSLRTNGSWGIGEFYDVKLLVDWAKISGLRMLQILPVNDTTNFFTNRDSYPYRANSVYALNPIYLNMSAIGNLENKKEQKQFEKKAKLLNKKKTIAYTEVYALKLAYLKRIYSQNSQVLFKSKSYSIFYHENRQWLLPYAVYSCLRDDFSTPNFQQWDKYSTYSSEKIEKYAELFSDKVKFYFFVQYYADKQLKEVHQYSNANGIALKGDLPIGIGATSVDAWMNPELFNLDCQAGAPPDDFSKNGQNWEFPTYNWETMSMDGYAWWKKRFKNMSKYFDAYRIDHILGFFRIWEINIDSIDGMLGYFNPALPFSETELKANNWLLDEKRMLQPFITKDSLKSAFFDKATYIINLFFTPIDEYRYSFRSEFATQRQLLFFFEKNANILSKKDQRRLLDFYQEVLFIEDKYQKKHYHPRIIPFETQTFQHLSEAEKGVFKTIHDYYFYERHNRFWKKMALKKMPLLLNTNDMLVCGEDLGMIPACVPEVMQQLHIIGLEVQRMPKQNYFEFIASDKVPYWSVFTTGTHDTSTLRSWWQENKEQTNRYYHQILAKKGKPPIKCDPTIVEAIIQTILHANSILAILPLQDVLALDANFVTKNPDEERINNPSDSNHFWCYRMSTTVEELLENDTLNTMLLKMLKKTSRI